MRELNFEITDHDTIVDFWPELRIHSIEVTVWVDVDEVTFDLEAATFDCHAVGIDQDGGEHDLGYSGDEFFGLGISDEMILDGMGL